ncbi:hypothetical protein Ga0100231_018190 [Opitutaceae bacterium TAV4]|nr:hypothetical protein Ga0100231_018190 [Opitutaceae bacterium TAV4]RRK00059.1 hypothetical protein Ga0100230_018870 [Opitutaceae bacterium TAV3]
MVVALLGGWANASAQTTSGQPRPATTGLPPFPAFPSYDTSDASPQPAPAPATGSSGISFPGATPSTSSPSPAATTSSPPNLSIRFIPRTALPPPTTEDDVLEIVRRHVVTLGGIDSILALRSILVKGTIKLADKHQLEFQMWSARPNRVRIQTKLKDRTLTEAYNGKDTPWMLDSTTNKAVDMAPDAVRPFIADAEFDDVLVSSLGRDNVILDYAGESTVDGRPVARLLATQNLTEISTIYVDRATYHIIRRDLVSKRTNLAVENYFADYKPVNGVMLPTRITQKHGGNVIYTVVNEHIEANPPLAPGFFDRPHE